MDVHIGTLRATIETGTTSAGTPTASGQQADEIVREVLRRLEAHHDAERARRAEARLWNSVLDTHGDAGGSGGAW